jgi:putative membrane protein
MINISFVTNAVVFAFLGVIIFWVSFLVIDLITPYKLWKELIEERNSALAIVVGAMSLGICLIIAAAIHG